MISLLYCHKYFLSVCFCVTVIPITLLNLNIELNIVIIIPGFCFLAGSFCLSFVWIYFDLFIFLLFFFMASCCILCLMKVLFCFFLLRRKKKYMFVDECLYVYVCMSLKYLMVSKIVIFNFAFVAKMSIELFN